MQERANIYNIGKYYDMIAEDEAREWYPNEMLSASIIEFMEYFGNNPKILDLGCGTGHESMRLAREGAKVVGIDISKHSIEIAKQRNPEIEFHEMQFSEIDKPLGDFDGIFASGSMIHLYEEDILDLLNKTRTVLKDKGYFLTIFQEGEGKRVLHYEIVGEVLERVIIRYSKVQMIRLFNSLGYIYIKDGIMSENPRNMWRNMIFQKVE